MIFESPTQSTIKPEGKERLEEKVKGLEKYVEDEDTFVIVYRGEGTLDDKSKRSSQPGLIGTWYTPTLESAMDFIKLAGESSEKTFLKALLIPKKMLDARDPIDIGLNQINIMNPYLLESAILLDIDNPENHNINNTKEYYLNQFSFYRDYYSDNR